MNWFPQIWLLSAATMLWSLSACVMIPHPRLAHKEPELCRVLASGRPPFIKAGDTSRPDVIAKLGDPSGAAIDGSWAVYGCASNKGGTGWFLLAGGGGGAYAGEAFSSDQYTFRRLVIHFNEAGIVSDANVETKSCTMKTSLLHDSAACLDLSGRDLIAVEDLPFLANEGDFVVFEDITWMLDDEQTVEGALVVTRKSLIVRTGCNYRLKQPCDLRLTTGEAAHIALTEIAAARLQKKWLLIPAVSLQLRGGRSRQFVVHDLQNRPRTGVNRAAAEAIRQRVDAIGIDATDNAVR